MTAPAALLIYESMFGATERAARAVAAGLGESVEVRVVEVGRAPSAVPPDVGLLVVGGPTHVFGLSRPNTRADAAQRTAEPLVSAGPGVREWLEGLGARPGLHGAAFGTRTARFGAGSAARGIARRLRRSRVTLLDRPLDLHVAGITEGLLDDEEDRAREWGARVGRAFTPATRVTR